MKDAHIKIKFTGSPVKIKLYNYIISSLDLDWPWGPFRRSPAEDLACKDCGGMIYRTPNLTPEELHQIAKQVDDSVRVGGNFKLKVKRFAKNIKCTQVPDEPDVDAASEVPPDYTRETALALMAGMDVACD